MSEFYRRLAEREIAERNARIFRDRPENLHDYQGCAKDAEVCRCGHTRRCHTETVCDDGCPCINFVALTRPMDTTR